LLRSREGATRHGLRPAPRGLGEAVCGRREVIRERLSSRLPKSRDRRKVPYREASARATTVAAPAGRRGRRATRSFPREGCGEAFMKAGSAGSSLKSGRFRVTTKAAKVVQPRVPVARTRRPSLPHPATEASARPRHPAERTILPYYVAPLRLCAFSLKIRVSRRPRRRRERLTECNALAGTGASGTFSLSEVPD
jgi:hypothetical protein